jgi:hypothetical protein
LNQNTVTAFTDNCEVGYLPVMAFLQKQELHAVYEPETALEQGTLFPELNKPFMGGCRRG